MDLIHGYEKIRYPRPFSNTLKFYIMRETEIEIVVPCLNNMFKLDSTDQSRVRLRGLRDWRMTRRQEMDYTWIYINLLMGLDL